MDSEDPNPVVFHEENDVSKPPLFNSQSHAPSIDIVQDSDDEEKGSSPDIDKETNQSSRLQTILANRRLQAAEANLRKGVEAKEEEAKKKDEEEEEILRNLKEERELHRALQESQLRSSEHCRHRGGRNRGRCKTGRCNTLTGASLIDKANDPLKLSNHRDNRRRRTDMSAAGQMTRSRSNPHINLSKDEGDDHGIDRSPRRADYRMDRSRRGKSKSRRRSGSCPVLPDDSSESSDDVDGLSGCRPDRRSKSRHQREKEHSPETRPHTTRVKVEDVPCNNSYEKKLSRDRRPRNCKSFGESRDCGEAQSLKKKRSKSARGERSIEVSSSHRRIAPASSPLKDVGISARTKDEKATHSSKSAFQKRASRSRRSSSANRLNLSKRSKSPVNIKSERGQGTSSGSRDETNANANMEATKRKPSRNKSFEDESSVCRMGDYESCKERRNPSTNWRDAKEHLSSVESRLSNAKALPDMNWRDFVAGNEDATEPMASQMPNRKCQSSCDLRSTGPIHNDKKAFSNHGLRNKAKLTALAQIIEGSKEPKNLVHCRLSGKLSMSCSTMDTLEPMIGHNAAHNSDAGMRNATWAKAPPKGSNPKKLSIPELRVKLEDLKAAPKNGKQGCAMARSASSGALDAVKAVFQRKQRLEGEGTSLKTCDAVGLIAKLAGNLEERKGVSSLGTSKSVASLTELGRLSSIKEVNTRKTPICIISSDKESRNTISLDVTSLREKASQASRASRAVAAEY